MSNGCGEAWGQRIIQWARPRIKAGVTIGGRVTAEAGRGFLRHNDFNLAASVAFYALLSFIPFFFVVISIAGRIIGSSETVFEAIDAVVEKVFPYYSGILMAEVTKISLGSGLYGVVGLLFIVWIGSLAFDSLQYALNVVFESPRGRSFLKSKMMSLSVFPAGGFLLILTLFLVTSFGAVARLPLSQHLPSLSFLQTHLIRYGMNLLPYLMLFGVLVLIFRIVPAMEIPYAQALTGAGLCTFGWVIEKWVFNLVILPNPNYGVVYGSLRALIILILWIFFSICLVLFSAEILTAYRRLKVRGNDHDRAEDSAQAG